MVVYFLGNSYTRLGDGRCIIGCSGVYSEDKDLQIRLKERPRYLYEYKGTCKKARKEVIPDSYAVDCVLFLHKLLVKIIGLDGDYAVSLKKQDTDWILGLVDLTKGFSRRVLQLNNKGWYAIQCDSSYNIVWSEYSNIIYNIDLLENIIAREGYKEIQGAVINSMVVGFGVWL